MYNYFEDDHYVYLILELCEKGELNRYLKTKRKTLSESEGIYNVYYLIVVLSGTYNVYYLIVVLSGTYNVYYLIVVLSGTHNVYYLIVVLSGTHNVYYLIVVLSGQGFIQDFFLGGENGYCK